MSRPFRVLLLVCLACVSVAATAAPAQSAERVSLELSDEARAAVDAGISLSFTCRYAIREPWWFFARERHSRTHRYTLKRHALSNRYIVTTDETSTPRIFRSAWEATNYIAEQASKLLESYSSDDQAYAMRISLNKYDLPTPMRLKAFIASSWDIDTGWIQWASAN